MERTRTIVVTGSASGIGAAVKARLTSKGHRVIGLDVRDADVIANLATAEGRAAGLAGLIEAAGGDAIDGFVPCAGVSNLPADVTLEINYLGTVELLRGLQPLLAKGDDPAAVLIASNSISLMPKQLLNEDAVTACMEGDIARAAELAPDYLAYPTSKLAIVRTVRTEGVGPLFAGAGIRVNAVAPGVIDTPMTQTLDEAKTAAMKQIPIPRGSFGKPEEVAAVIDFLLSPEASFVHGAVWFVDGGTDAVVQTTRF